MTTPVHAGVDRVDLEAFVDQQRQQGATAEGRFVRQPIADATAVNTVLAWLQAQGLNEALPENLDVTISSATPDTMMIRRFRWKAGHRDDLTNVARRNGVEITEHTYWRMREPFTQAVLDAFDAAGVPLAIINGELRIPDDERGPTVDANPATGRPAMEQMHAELCDLWLAPNGIAEWVPERAAFVVTADAITYESFGWRGPRGYNSNLATRRELEPHVDGDKADDIVIEHRTVPLLAPLTDQVRELFAASELTLTEVK